MKAAVQVSSCDVVIVASFPPPISVSFSAILCFVSVSGEVVCVVTVALST